MCNRYTPARGEDLERDLFGAPTVNFPPSPLFPKYGQGIGPNQDGPFLRLVNGGVEEVIGQWGLIRPGQRTRVEIVGGRPRLTNNCRSETMASKPTFRQAWQQGKRCLIPAWGFQEPNYETKKNVWWEMRRSNAQPWALAGLWSEWTDPESGEMVPSYTMITINCNLHPLMSQMHRPEPDAPLDQRAVVPLDPSVWSLWLHGSLEDAADLLSLPGESTYAAGSAATMPPPPFSLPAAEQPSLL